MKSITLIVVALLAGCFAPVAESPPDAGLGGGAAGGGTAGSAGGSGAGGGTGAAGGGGFACGNTGGGGGTAGGVGAGGGCVGTAGAGMLSAAETVQLNDALTHCAIPESGRRWIETSEPMTAELTGIWAQCSGNVLAPLSGEVGMQFACDGQWYRLLKDASGVHRTKSPQAAGRWTVIGKPQFQLLQPQLNIELNSGGTVQILPRLSVNPRKVLLFATVNQGVWATGGGTAGTVSLLSPVELISLANAAALCAVPQSGQRTFQDAKAVSAELIGIWAQCGVTLFPPPEFPAVSNEVGMQFAADGSWYRLVKDANCGGVRRLQDFSGGGRWMAYSATQVNLELNGGVTKFSSPRFAVTPNKIDFSDINGATQVWAREP